MKRQVSLLVASVVLVFLFFIQLTSATSVTISQSGADTGSVMKGTTFVISVTGLSGSGSVNLIDLPTGFSSEEGTVKSFAEGTSSVTWTTATISQVQTNIKIKATVTITGSPSTAESSSFDVVLPPSISVAISPSEVSIEEGDEYTVTLTIENDGETSAKSVSLSLSGEGMEKQSGCGTITSILPSGSSSATCTILASTVGSDIPVTFTATPSNADSKSAQITVNVTEASVEDDEDEETVSRSRTSSKIDETVAQVSLVDSNATSAVLAKNERVIISFTRLSEPHFFTITDIDTFERKVTFTIESEIKTFTLSEGESAQVDLNNDNISDIEITLEDIKSSSEAVFVFTQLQASESISTPSPVVKEENLCGNGVCDAQENYENCATDCPKVSEEIETDIGLELVDEIGTYEDNTPQIIIIATACVIVFVFILLVFVLKKKKK